MHLGIYLMVQHLQQKQTKLCRLAKDNALAYFSGVAMTRNTYLKQWLDD
jgi:hypothetical protein